MGTHSAWNYWLARATGNPVLTVSASYSLRAGGTVEYVGGVPGARVPSGNIIVLARPDMFRMDPETDEPVAYLPMERRNWGTAWATAEIGWGEVISVEAPMRAEAGDHRTAVGQLYGGYVEDPIGLITVRCILEMATADDLPETGDHFFYNGKRYTVSEVVPEDAQGESKSLTISGRHWPGANRTITPPVLPSPGPLI
jgi:hypothetical protein